MPSRWPAATCAHVATPSAAQTAHLLADPRHAIIIALSMWCDPAAIIPDPDGKGCGGFLAAPAPRARGVSEPSRTPWQASGGGLSDDLSADGAGGVFVLGMRLRGGQTPWPPSGRPLHLSDRTRGENGRYFSLLCLDGRV